MAVDITQMYFPTVPVCLDLCRDSESWKDVDSQPPLACKWWSEAQWFCQTKWALHLVSVQTDLSDLRHNPVISPALHFIFTTRRQILLSNNFLYTILLFMQLMEETECGVLLIALRFLSRIMFSASSETRSHNQGTSRNQHFITWTLTQEKDVDLPCQQIWKSLLPSAQV